MPAAWTAVLAAACLAGLGACSRTNHKIPDAAPAEPPELYQPVSPKTALPEQLIERPAYRLTVGDVLEVIYHIKNVVTAEPYQLQLEDVIRIRFPYQEKFDQEVTVASDGNVHCLLLGQVRAAGLTANQLEDQLRRGYARYLRNPELTVVVKAANVKIEELKKAITTAPRGQSRLVPVKPDGTIDLPYVGEVMVAGRKVHEAKKVLDGLYAESDLPEVEVTVQILEFASKRIFVMGEVLQPGAIETRTPITLFQAVIQAGGPNVRADQTKILLVRRDFLPVPQAVVFDMQKLLTGWKASPRGRIPDGSQFRYDMYLADGDIIYVPPSALAASNDWIDQVFTRGIRSVLPYNAYLGANFGYQMYNAETPIKSRAVGPPNIQTQLGP
jgi:polysaccharide biosynthesis/export protein